MFRQGHNAQVLSKKEHVFAQKIANFPRNSSVFQKKKKSSFKKIANFLKKKRCQNFFASFLAGHFRELAGFEAKFKDFKLVLQDFTSAIKLGTKFSSAKT